MKFARTTVDPHQIGGVSWVWELRIPAATVVRMVTEGLMQAGYDSVHES